MQEASDISIVPMNVNECTEFKNPISTVLSCDQNNTTHENQASEKNLGANLSNVTTEEIPLEDVKLEKNEESDSNFIAPEKMPVLEDVLLVTEGANSNNLTLENDPPVGSTRIENHEATNMHQILKHIIRNCQSNTKPAE